MFEKMSLKAKLTLVAAVPIAVMLIFGISGAWQKFTDYRQREQAQSLANLVVAMGEVTHELQKERGMNAGFINSHGGKFADTLTTQRKLSDEKIAFLQQAVGRIDRSFVGPRYIKLLENIGVPLAELAGKREQSSRFALEASESFRFYSDLIAQLLEVTVRTGNQMPSSKLSRLSNAKQALLYLKERNGQERALLTGAFSAGHLTTAQFNAFLALLGDQANFHRIAISYAMPEQEKLLRDKLSDPVVKELESIEQMVKDKGADAELVYSVEDWFAKISAKIDLLRTVEERFSTDIQNEISANMDEARRALWFYLLMLAASLVLAVWLCFQLVRNLMRTIGGEPNQAAVVVNAIADGDLTRTIALAKGDETSLLAAVARMQLHLREMIGEVRNATQHVADSSATLSSIAGQVEASSVQGSDSAMSIAAAVEEMTVSIQHISANADDVSTTTRETERISNEGHATMEGAAREMQVIAEMVTRSADAVGDLANQSDHIAGIVKVIKEISDKTNLLALNAAIEAARAGEHGRGFAVVADEVRKLAELTRDSTVEISRTLDAIHVCMDNAQENMSSSNAKVASGVTETEQAGRSMAKIQGAARQIMQAIEEISASLREQSKGSAVISAKVDQIATHSEETAVAVKTVAETSTRMEGLAKQLEVAVNRFRF